jgi:hypothetical protein
MVIGRRDFNIISFMFMIDLPMLNSKVIFGSDELVKTSSFVQISILLSFQDNALLNIRT